MFRMTKKLLMLVLFSSVVGTVCAILTEIKIFSVRTIMIIAVILIALLVFNYFHARNRRKGYQYIADDLLLLLKKKELKHVSIDLKVFFNDVLSFIEQKDHELNKLKKEQEVFLDVIKKIKDKTVNQEENYNQFNSIIFDLSGGIQTQSNSARDSSKAMEEMTKGVTKIAEMAAESNRTSRKAAETANAGITEVMNVTNQMETIQESFDQLANIISHFEESCTEVGKITQGISDLAKQTDLLSLNASIEAARAGVEGRGFAVVANEVGKLAKESNQLAGKVSELIVSLQRKSQDAMEAMNVSHTDVLAGTTIVKQTSESFESIIDATVAINSQIHDITGISQEIAAGSQQVAASIDEISLIASKSSQQFNQIIPIIIEQFDVTNSISEIVEHK